MVRILLLFRSLAVFFIVPFASLSGEGSINGVITDSSTKLPIPGALVKVKQGHNVVASASTDNLGNYAIMNISPGTYSITVKHELYRSASRNVAVEDDSIATARFALPRYGNIAGKAVDLLTDAPLPGAAVKVFLGNSLVATTIAAEDGSFYLLNLNPARYTITASAEDFQSFSQLIGVKSSQTTTIDLYLNRAQTWNLNRAGCITGQVLDISINTPIAEAAIDVLEENKLIASALTDIDGSYTVSGLAPDNYLGKASAAEFQTSILGASIQGNETLSGHFALNPNPEAIAGPPVKPISEDSVQIFQKGIHKRRILRKGIRANFAPGIDRMHRSKWPASFDHSVTSCWLFRKEK